MEGATLPSRGRTVSYNLENWRKAMGESLMTEPLTVTSVSGGRINKETGEYSGTLTNIAKYHSMDTPRKSNAKKWDESKKPTPKQR